MAVSRSSQIAMGVFAGVCLSVAAASGGCLGLNPAPGAGAPAQVLGGIDTVSQCPSFVGINPPAPGYQGEADPVFQRLCVNCHASGGQGAAKFLLIRGDSNDSSTAAANFFVARNEAVPVDGSVTVDPINPDGTSPLLERLNGTVTHDLTLDIGGDDYAAIRDWVTQELSQTCVINPSTGTVSVVAPSPKPSP